MNTTMNATGTALERYLPIALCALILVVGYVRFVQPHVSEYVGLRGEIQAAESRVKTLRESAGRDRPAGTVDEGSGLREFERRVPERDVVVEVVEKLARAALDGVPDSQVHHFSIQTGIRTASSIGPVASQGALNERPDPRLSLFGATLQHTPVTISFESSFAVIGEFIWRLRNMPTIVEIRSATLTRGLPHMKVELTVYAYQRTGPAGSGIVNQPAPLATQPGAPRVAMQLDGEGWSR